MESEIFKRTVVLFFACRSLENMDCSVIMFIALPQPSLKAWTFWKYFWANLLKYEASEKVILKNRECVRHGIMWGYWRWASVVYANAFAHVLPTLLEEGNTRADIFIKRILGTKSIKTMKYMWKWLQRSSFVEIWPYQKGLCTLRRSNCDILPG